MIVNTYSGPYPDCTIVPDTMTSTGGYCVLWQPEPMPELDERTNPRAWARWFREFLFDLLGGWPVYKIIQICKLARMLSKPRARSWLIFREWKMKTWKQRLYAN